MTGSPRGSDFESRVRAVLDALMPGELVTYGEVAEEAGHPGAARAVGNVLATSEGLPWWRVVTGSGRLVPGHEREQARRLRAEGVPVSGGRVRVPRDLDRAARRRGGGRAGRERRRYARGDAQGPGWKGQRRPAARREQEGAGRS